MCQEEAERGMPAQNARVVVRVVGGRGDRVYDIVLQYQRSGAIRAVPPQPVLLLGETDELILGTMRYWSPDSRGFAEKVVHDDLIALRVHADMLAEALRLTQDYVGDEVLPPIEGWSWYDALQAHNDLTGRRQTCPT